MEEQEQPLHPHHPLRYVVLLVFIAVLILSTKDAGQSFSYQPTTVSTQVVTEPAVPIEPAQPIAPIAVQTPTAVRGVYLTEWSAGNPKVIDRIINLIDTTELNAVVIDIKDATGRLSYQPEDPMLRASGVGTNHIKDLRALTTALHAHGIYVIGRVQVFEDPYYAQNHPEDAFRDTRTNGPWRDYKGIMWLKPNDLHVWEYTAAIARDAHEQGVDEINLDYVRFPSDGELQFLDLTNQTQTRVQTLESFFTYIGDMLHADHSTVSADIFGLTMSARDDLGIGQKVEAIAPHVDYVCPMVYPSHFAIGTYGIQLPAEHPYEIIKKSLSDGVQKLAAIGIGPEKLRPWLQDFDLGATYTSDMVRSQIAAAEDVGINAWLLWDPRNVYTQGALLPQ